MNFSFDLISDLHIETWEQDFDWTGQATSQYCIVAGDVCRDRDILIKTLTELGRCYLGVFYIDGNDEHRHSLHDLGDSYSTLADEIQAIPNVVYLHDHCIIVNGVAIVAVNGWWTHDFDPTIDFEQCVEWNRDRYKLSKTECQIIQELAYSDASYMINSVSKLQTHNDVKAIVLVSHTVPSAWLIDHDLELCGTYRFNAMGNSYIEQTINRDTMNKIHTWCFGHYHKPVDQYKHGIRYVSNCKGRGDTDWKQVAYYPKKITIDY